MKRVAILLINVALNVALAPLLYLIGAAIIVRDIFKSRIPRT